jgi:hypothetical protein
MAQRPALVLLLTRDLQLWSRCDEMLSQGGHDEGQLQVLRWVYGGLACAQNLDFLERQAEVPPCSKTRVSCHAVSAHPAARCHNRPSQHCPLPSNARL